MLMLRILLIIAVPPRALCLPYGYNSRHRHIPSLYASKNEGVLNNKMFSDQLDVGPSPSPSYLQYNGEVRPSDTGRGRPSKDEDILPHSVKLDFLVSQIDANPKIGDSKDYMMGSSKSELALSSFDEADTIVSGRSFSFPPEQILHLFSSSKTVSSQSNPDLPEPTRGEHHLGLQSVAYTSDGDQLNVPQGKTDPYDSTLESSEETKPNRSGRSFQFPENMLPFFFSQFTPAPVSENSEAPTAEKRERHIVGIDTVSQLEHDNFSPTGKLPTAIDGRNSRSFKISAKHMLLPLSAQAIPASSIPPVQSEPLPAAPKNLLNLGLESVPHNPFALLEDVASITTENSNIGVNNLIFNVETNKATFSGEDVVSKSNLLSVSSQTPVDRASSHGDEPILHINQLSRNFPSRQDLIESSIPKFDTRHLIRDGVNDTVEITPRVSMSSHKPWQYGLLSVKPVCQETERIEWVTKCEDYPEVTCTSSHKESCEKEMFKNCTGVISTEVERICFSLNEQICKLKEHVTYETVEENFLVTKCSKVKERICDTIFHTSTFSKDDFQCIDLESPSCYLADSKVNETVCRHYTEFDCDKKSLHLTSGDGIKQERCEQKPVTSCYGVPRTVHVETCKQEVRKHCQKLSDNIPFPMESQNCHYEPKKVCDVQTRVRAKKIKNLSYSADCTLVPRQMCDSKETKKLGPYCEDVERLKCSYKLEPGFQCTEETRQFCYQVEQLVVEETCQVQGRNI